jgi:hypothetical protein
MEAPDPMKARTLTTAFSIAAAVPALGAIFAACVEPPPKISSIPSSGLAVRLYVFGASAQEARQAFQAAKQNNKNFSVVKEGGDGEILLGLDNDSPKCVAPTAFCSFKLSFRIKDNQANMVHAATTSVSATAERCGDLCDRALNSAVVKVIEAAVVALKHGPVEDDGGSDAGEGGPVDTSEAGASVTPPTSASADASTPAKPVAKKAGGKEKEKPAPPKPEPARPEPAICAVGHGPHLPADEAERRAAQVEALKRMSVLDQDEYDCLRKAYLERL